MRGGTRAGISSTRVERVEELNCHHNYTTRETHFGRDVWLSRKGAIHAAKGMRGLIPGSMGTASYVVTGKGDALALQSSPHGAGRNYSRTAARKRFTRESLDTAMKGIAWGGRTRSSTSTRMPISPSMSSWPTRRTS